jgi:4'-phosphopantetheinyl transferase
MERYQQWLTPAERRRQQRYRRAADQLRFVVGRGLLRQLLERATGRPAEQWTFATSRFGRPAAIEPGAPPFNLSHSDGMTVCAVSNTQQLGVDLETRRHEDHWHLAQRFFARPEAERVRRLPTAEQRGACFLRLWTLKEAYIKAVGKGLSIELDSFWFELDDGPAPRLRPPDDSWQFFELPHPDYQIAVATRSAGPRPELRQQDPRNLWPGSG